MYQYLEIVSYENNKVSLRINVTEKTERQVERIEKGMNINLNHEEYFTRRTQIEKELPVIKSGSKL